MNPDEMLRSGDLAGALAAQTAVLREHPTDQIARISLIHLLVLRGEWDRAESQLLTVAKQDGALQMATAMYRGLLSAEEERARVVAGTTAPNLPPGSPPYVADRIAALHAVQVERHADAEALIARARSAEPVVTGMIDGLGFSSLSDYDDILGPVLEVFAGGRYFWVEFARLQNIGLQAPRSTLDLVWLPATMRERDGVEARVHLPVHYAGTHGHEDPLVRAGRKTAWEDVGGFAFRGFGPRLWLADGARELPMLSVRTLTFGNPEP